MTNAPTSQKLSCFVSADSSTDTSAVEQALADVGVRVIGIKDVPIGSNLSNAIAEIVLSADFVCVVLREGDPSPAVMFEAGIATGSRRPMVAVVPAGAFESTYLAMLGSPIVRTEPGNFEALVEQLRSYVQFVQPVAAQLKLNWVDLIDESKRSTFAGEKKFMEARSLQDRVAIQLQKLGGLVSTNEEVAPNHEVDALVTLPSLGAPFNPIVVEVKARAAEPDSAVVQQIMRSLRAVNSRIGIFVHAGGVGSPRVIEHNAISIVSVSIGELETMGVADFGKLIMGVRNRLIHSI